MIFLVGNVIHQLQDSPQLQDISGYHRPRFQIAAKAGSLSAMNDLGVAGIGKGLVDLWTNVPTTTGLQFWNPRYSGIFYHFFVWSWLHQRRNLTLENDTTCTYFLLLIWHLSPKLLETSRNNISQIGGRWKSTEHPGVLSDQNATFCRKKRSLQDMYRLGQGTKKDYSEALRWYQLLGASFCWLNELSHETNSLKKSNPIFWRVFRREILGTNSLGRFFFLYHLWTDWRAKWCKIVPQDEQTCHVEICEISSDLRF